LWGWCPPGAPFAKRRARRLATVAQLAKLPHTAQPH
jgi:hypothetical protein